MAQKITVALEDDLDDRPADETVRFGLEGADHEIDLSSKNARWFRTQLMQIEHGRTQRPLVLLARIAPRRMAGCE